MKMKSIANNFSLAELEERTGYLSEFMLPERLENMIRVLDQRTDYITLAAENIYHAQNASAMVRHCEAFGIQSIHTAENLCPFHPTLNVVRGTDQWIDINHHPSTKELIGALKSKDYRIIATTPHRQSCTPEDLDISKGKFAIVMGTEKTGVTDEMMENADEYLRIPMCGMVESLNVSASAAIITYILTQRLKRERDDWHLDNKRKAELLYRWCCLSVRDSELILKKRFGSAY